MSPTSFSAFAIANFVFYLLKATYNDLAKFQVLWPCSVRVRGEFPLDFWINLTRIHACNSYPEK